MSGSTLRVLAYHRIVDLRADQMANPSLVSATPAAFERQVRHLAARYRVVSLDDVLAAQGGERPLPKRAVLLTFDDAYRDFAEVAWPVLRRYGMPATVFVPTAYPDTGRVFWWDRLHVAIQTTGRRTVRHPLLGTLNLETVQARLASLRLIQSCVKRIDHARAMLLVDELCDGLDGAEPRASDILGWDELRALSKEGVSLGSHTRTHPALPRMDAGSIAAEIRGSLEDLKREIGFVPPVFCSPYGLFDARVVEETRTQGIELAFTCAEGHNRLPSADPLRIRRTVITRRTTSGILALRLWRAVSHLDRWRKGASRMEAGEECSIPEKPAADGTATPGMRVAYLVSRFPKLSETFVLNEMLALEALGVEVELYPLLRERQPVAHPEVERWLHRARFHPFFSLPILRAQVHFIRRQPSAYFGVLFEVLRETFGSANFFIGALGIFPKSVRFAYEMRERRVMHVHAHFASHPAVAALIVHRLTGIPFSFTAHGSDLHVERRMLAAKVRAAAFAVTISRFNREVIVRESGEHLRSKIHVIHCGVDPDFFAPPAIARNGGPIQLTCVASLEPVKGHAFLLEACRILADRGRHFRCDLVGDGPLRHELAQRRVRLGLTGHVHMHGGRPRTDVARLLARSDIGVLASHPTPEGRREGIPVALMEAMAAGLPVVATAISGIPELIEEGVTGLLVPSGDPLALADALDRLMGDMELRRRMGLAGRQKVMREFDLAANTRELLERFRGVWESKDRGRADNAAIAVG